jgi:hypothetical protein
MSLDIVKPKTIVSEARGEPKAGKDGKEVAAARVDERVLAEAGAAEAEDPKAAKDLKAKKTKLVEAAKYIANRKSGREQKQPKKYEP